VPRSLPDDVRISPSSRCDPSQPGARRSEFTNRSAKLYTDTSRFFVSAASLDDNSAVSALRSTTSRSSAGSSETTTSSSDCRLLVDQDEIAVNWTTVRLLFVFVDVLLLVHRLTKLYVDLDQMRLSAAVNGLMWPLSDSASAGGSISVLPVDGVASPVQTMSIPPLHVGNHVGAEARGSVDGDDDEGLDFTESRATNSLCVTTERAGSNAVSSCTLTRRRSTGTGNTWHRRALRSSPDIVPRLVCLVALLAALFHARATTTGRGVMWLRAVLPSYGSPSPTSASAVDRHFHADVGVDSLSDDFRQLQAFVDFFNRGKSVVIVYYSEFGNG